MLLFCDFFFFLWIIWTSILSILYPYIMSINKYLLFYQNFLMKRIIVRWWFYTISYTNTHEIQSIRIISSDVSMQVYRSDRFSHLFHLGRTQMWRIHELLTSRLYVCSIDISQNRNTARGMIRGLNFFLIVDNLYSRCIW